MNPQWFGDSFDIVKRFFVDNLKEIGYTVYVNPMLTGEWIGKEKSFYKFLNVHHQESMSNSSKNALLLDPDTGIGSKRSKRHTTIQDIVDLLDEYEIVFSFDQSFSRNAPASEALSRKLKLLKSKGGQGFYYDSHARFLFAAKQASSLQELKEQLVGVGLPRERLVTE